MKRLFTQIILSVFGIQLIMSGFPAVNVYAANAPLRNIVEGGDMETETVPAGWVVSSSASGSELEIVEDTQDPTNHVLRFDGTSNNGTISYMSYSEPLASGTEYYYSYKIRIAEEDTNTGSLYAYMGLTTGVNDDHRPPLSKEWVSRSGKLNGTGAKMSFKIISNQGSQSSNVPRVIYEVDDIVICDMSGAEVLNLSSELNGSSLSWKTGVVKKGDSLYARPDSTASFTLTPPLNHEIDTVTVNGDIVTPVDDIYNIEIPSDLAVDVIVDVIQDSGVPHLLSTSPKSGVLNADPQDMVLKVGFDRNMNPDTITAGNVIVTPSASFEVETDTNSEYTYNLIFEDLLEAIEYTVVFTENLESEFGVPMEESYTYTFNTASSGVNIIENGDMSNTSSTIYDDTKSGSLVSYTEDDGNSVLRWEVTWTNAPLTQYLNNDSREKEYNFIGGHKYYVKARVKAEKEVKMVWSILYTTGTDTASTHPQTWVTLKPEKWTVLHSAFTVPANVNIDSNHGVRLVAGSYPNVVYVDDVELIDCSITPGGKPELVSSYPENSATEVEIDKGELEMTLTFDKPMLPTTLNTTNITAEEATIKDIKMSDDKKTCILTLSQLKVNKTVKIKYKNLTSMASEKVDEGSVTFSTKTISTATPSIVKSVPANGAKVALSSLDNMEIEYNLPLDGPIDKSSFTAVPENLIDSVVWTYDNPNAISIKINQECLSAGNTYSVTLLPSIKSQASTPINEETITFSTITLEEIVQNFKDSQTDVQGVLDFITNYYGDLVPDDTLCENMMEKDPEIAEKFAEQILENGVDQDADAEDIAEIIHSNAVLVTVNRSQNKGLIGDAVNSVLITENMTSLSDTFNALADSDKTEFCSDIKDLTKDFESSQDLINYLKPQIILTAIKKSNGWKAISDVLNNNIKYLKNDTKELIKNINKLSNKGEIYLKLQGVSVSSESEIYNILKPAYDSMVVKPNDKPSLGGGGGGGGAGIPTEKLTVIPGSEPEVPTVNEEKPPVFRDIDSVPWAKEAIEHFYELKVITGKTADTFCPNDFVTREEFVKMIVVAANIPMTENSHKYSDVDQNAWYYAYISAATNAKLVQGMDSLTFGVGHSITRQDIATICNRLLLAAEDDEELSGTAEVISDYNDVSEYAREAVGRLVSLDIIKGDENGRFAPHKYATRAETAVLLQRLIAFKTTEGR